MRKSEPIILCAAIAAATLCLGVTSANAAVTVTSTAVTTFTGFTSANAADTTAGITAAYTQADSDPKFGQSVQTITGGTLTDIELLVSGNTSGNTLSLALYDAGAGAGNLLKDNSSRGYGTADATDPYTGSFDHTTVSDNLLTAAAQNITLPSAGASFAIFDFNFTGPDAITLLANEEYVVEANGDNGSAFFFIRQANNATEYANGQAYKSTQPLNGNADRDWAVGVNVAAVTSSPEPASLAVLGLGAVALLGRKRKA